MDLRGRQCTRPERRCSDGSEPVCAWRQTATPCCPECIPGVAKGPPGALHKGDPKAPAVGPEGPALLGLELLPPRPRMEFLPEVRRHLSPTHDGSVWLWERFSTRSGSMASGLLLPFFVSKLRVRILTCTLVYPRQNAPDFLACLRRKKSDHRIELCKPTPENDQIWCT